MDRREARVLGRSLTLSGSMNPPINVDGLLSTSGPDRLGSNCIPWLQAMALSRVTSLPLWRWMEGTPWNHEGCRTENRDSVMYQVLSRESKEISLLEDLGPEVAEGKLYTRRLRSPQLPGEEQDLCPIVLEADATRNSCLCLANKTLPALLRETGLGKVCFEEFTRESERQGWELPFDPLTSLIIHVRLGDSRHNIDGDSSFRQGWAGEDALINFMRHLSLKYPTHKIHLMVFGGSPAITRDNYPEGEFPLQLGDENDVSLCEKIIKKSGVECGLLGTANCDFDLWQLMSCDVLIAGRSYFSLLAALLHQGKEVYSHRRWEGFDNLIQGVVPDEKNIDNFDKTQLYSIEPKIIKLYKE